jgi:hypothetical protein
MLDAMLKAIALAFFATLPAILLTAGCVTVPAPDPQIVELVRDLRTQSAAFYEALPNASPSACTWEHNKNLYLSVGEKATELQAYVVRSRVSKNVIHAANALAQAIAHAARSHQLASAITDDPQGPCLAPSAIVLNADAIDSASAALILTQTARGLR